MDIETTKLELMQLLLQTQKESVLEKLQQVFEEESKDWWDDLDSDERKEIETGIEQADRGEYVEHSEVRKNFSKWH